MHAGPRCASAPPVTSAATADSAVAAGGNTCAPLPHSWRGLGPQVILSLAVVLGALHCAAESGPVEAFGLRLPAGFSITLYADSDLANDVTAMTLDAEGRVVLTGPGYIRTLLDTNNHGRAEQAVLFAATQTGGAGMCFEGGDLYFVGDGYLSRYRDADGDGVADGAPERLLPVASGEHGGHAVRKGPDGWLYLMGGNDSGFNPNNHVTLATSPVRVPEAGALLRVAPDGSGVEVLAHGFRNPRDFDFHPWGDILTYDSDVEGDLYLPWHTPPRLYHIAQGGHHGWRLNGWQRSWNRPGYYGDTVDILFLMGRSLPTGVVCYRHQQFPERFQNGFFFLDWEFGRVFFTPLVPEGATFRAQPERFIEPMGTQGFAPTGLEVAPDGSLFICTGGRKTRGAVYRIQYIGPRPEVAPVVNPLPAGAEEVDQVLRAPQPLAAWSRARWMPAAQKVGVEGFGKVAADPKFEPAVRVRAIEVITELFQGLSTVEARLLARDLLPQVRGRVAWSIGRAPCANFIPILFPLALDRSPYVRRCALEAIAGRLDLINATDLLQVIPANLAHEDKRVRQAATRLAAGLPDPSWAKLSVALNNAAPQARLSHVMATLWRYPDQSVNTNLVETLLTLLKRSLTPDQRLQAVRLIMLALGDYHLQNPSVEVDTAYELAGPLEEYPALLTRIQNTVRPLLPSNHPLLDGEAARLLAMLEDPNDELVEKGAKSFSPQSGPASDFHFLTVLSRLRGRRTNTVTAQVAQAVLSLDRKLQRLQVRPGRNWTFRFNEVVTQLVRRDADLPEAMLRHADFARPEHVHLVTCLGPEHRQRAAGLFLAAVKQDPQFQWSSPLIALLSRLPEEEVRPLYRQQWSKVALRGELVRQLVVKPDPVDRDKLLAMLESSQPQVVRSCVTALQELPRDETPERIVPLLRLLRRLLGEPDQGPLRQQVAALLARQTDLPGKVEEKETAAAALKRAYQPLFDTFAQQHPQLARKIDRDAEADPAAWARLLRSVPWNRGNPVAGAAVAQQHGCAACHASAGAVGPDLTGVTSRFSAEELFNAIAFPGRDVALPYRPTTLSTRDGRTYTGIVVLESAEGVVLQTGTATAMRLAQADIAALEPSQTSLMPKGLLVGVSAQNLADLYSFLRTLRPSGR
jgi:putative heme-binding domain-containing protein